MGMITSMSPRRSASSIRGAAEDLGLSARWVYWGSLGCICQKFQDPAAIWHRRATKFGIHVRLYVSSSQVLRDPSDQILHCLIAKLRPVWSLSKCFDGAPLHILAPKTSKCA